MAKKDWVMVRLERQVWERLRERAESLERARQLGHTDSVESDTVLSLSDLIARLLARDDRRRERARQSRSRTRAQKRAELEGIVYVTAPTLTAERLDEVLRAFCKSQGRNGEKGGS